RDRPGAGPWQARLDPSLHPWIAEHRVDGHAVLPAAAFAAIAVAAARETGQRGVVEVDGLDILAPLAVSADGVELRTSFDDASGGLTIESRPQGSALPWQAHARASLCRAPAPGAGAAMAAMMQAGRHSPVAAALGQSRDVDPVRLYDELSLNGLGYGPRFRLLQRCCVDREGTPGALVSAVVGMSPEGVGDDAVDDSVDGGSGSLFRGTISPMMLDASFHALAALLDTTAAPATWLPTRMARLWLGADAPRPGTPWHVVARLRQRRPTWILADLVVRAPDGDPFLAVEGLSLEARPQPGLGDLEDWCETWVPLPMPTRTPTPVLAQGAANNAPASSTPNTGTVGIADALRRAGHWLPEEPAPDEALLLEELCKLAVAEALGAGTPESPGGPLRVALQAREAARAAVDASGTAALPEGAEDLIPAGEIVPRLLARRPDAARALQSLLALPETLRAAFDGEAEGAPGQRAVSAPGPFSAGMAVAPLIDVLTTTVEDVVSGKGRPRALLLGVEEGWAGLSSSVADWLTPMGPDGASLAPGSEADGLAGCADLAIRLAGFGDGAGGQVAAMERVSAGGELLTVILPAPGSVFPEPGAVEAAADALRSAGATDVETGWFDAGTHVLGLVAARPVAGVREAVPAATPPISAGVAGAGASVASTEGEASPLAVRDEAPSSETAIVLLHDEAGDAREAAAALLASVTSAEARPLSAPGC
ncbi:MAG: polyketide synthase dehydratase domain-containing protein, partial [Pseudomonadota bacterium]